MIRVLLLVRDTIEVRPLVAGATMRAWAMSTRMTMTFVK